VAGERDTGQPWRKVQRPRRQADGAAGAPPTCEGQLARLARGAWRLTRALFATAFETLLALIIVFEEWGWRPLADGIGRLARWQPWARVEASIARLPPYAALAAFVLPTLLLLPLKFVALLLIANGRLLLASGLFVAAKIVATALIARLFALTQPALMQIGWFAWSYDTAMPWKEALTERVRASWAWRLGRLWKERGRRLAAGLLRRLRPRVLALGAAIADGVAAAGKRLRLRTVWRLKRLAGPTGRAGAKAAARRKSP